MKKYLIITLILALLFIGMCPDEINAQAFPNPSVSPVEPPPGQLLDPVPDPQEDPTPDGSPVGSPSAAPSEITCNEEGEIRESKCSDDYTVKRVICRGGVWKEEEVKCDPKTEYCGNNEETGNFECLKKEGTCCKCIVRHYENNEDGNCYKQSCENWLEDMKPFCNNNDDPGRVILVPPGETLPTEEDPTAGCDKKYLNAVIEMVGHSGVSEFENILTYCAFNIECPSIRVNDIGCFTCSDPERCRELMNDYLADANVNFISITGMQGTCIQGDEESYSRTSYIYVDGGLYACLPPCSELGICAMGAPTATECLVNGPDVYLMDGPKPETELKICCCDSSKDYTTRGKYVDGEISPPNAGIMSNGFLGKYVTVTDKNAKCKAECTSGNRDENKGDYASAGNNNGCATFHNSCGYSRSRGRWVKRIFGCNGNLASVDLESCGENQVCIENGRNDGAVDWGVDPECVDEGDFRWPFPILSNVFSKAGEAGNDLVLSQEAVNTISAWIYE
jgi:hypothetical protein